MGFFQGTQERVRNSRGRRAISVRAIEVILYIPFLTRQTPNHKTRTKIIPNDQMHPGPKATEDSCSAELSMTFSCS